MKFQLPYVTVEVDDRLRQRLAQVGDELRINITAYMRSAADDLGTAGEAVRGLFDHATARVNAALASANKRIAPAHGEQGDTPSAGVTRGQPDGRVHPI